MAGVQSSHMLLGLGLKQPSGHADEPEEMCRVTIAFSWFILVVRILQWELTAHESGLNPKTSEVVRWLPTTFTDNPKISERFKKDSEYFRS